MNNNDRLIAPSALLGRAIQSRASDVAQLEAEYTAIIEQARLEGDDWPFPHVVAFEVDNGDLVLVDGIHRTRAALAAHWAQVPTVVYKGTMADALAFAVKANANHGARRTQADVRQAIKLLLQSEEYGRASDRKIADTVMCSPTTVGTVRSELGLTQTRRVGSDGITRSTPTVVGRVTCAGCGKTHGWWLPITTPEGEVERYLCGYCKHPRLPDELQNAANDAEANKQAAHRVEKETRKALSTAHYDAPTIPSGMVTRDETVKTMTFKPGYTTDAVSNALAVQQAVIAIGNGRDRLLARGLDAEAWRVNALMVDLLSIADEMVKEANAHD